MAKDYEAQMERQQANVTRLMSDPTSGWYGLPYDVVDYYTSNSPFGLEASGWEPGREISLDELGKMLWRMNLPDMSDDFEAGSMTLDRYLADPRSVISASDGKFTYNPQQAYRDGKINDFTSKNRESFMDEWAPVLSAWLPFVAPYLQSIGVVGAGAGAVGSGAGGVEGGVGAGSAIGGGAGDFSLVAPGSNTGIGGVGTSGLGLNTAGIGLTPELVAAGGGAGALGIGGGTGLQAVNTAGAALDAAGVGAGATGGSWWDSLVKSVTDLPGGSGTATAGGSILEKLLKGGGSILEFLQSEDNAKLLADAINNAADRGDPFSKERPFYQNMLRESYTDPNFWNKNAVFKGISDVASSDAQRVAASRGFNNSSNVLYDVADRIQKTGMNYATNFQGQLAQNAGAGISPGTSATIAAQGANQVMGANQQANGALGNVLSNIPNLVNGLKGLFTGP